MREHIEFIQAQRLPWEDATRLGLPGAAIKMLSHDPDDGSFSSILRLPQGWTRPAGALLEDEELYLLDGAARIGAESFLENTYAFLPAACADNAIVVENETHLLYFRSGATPEAMRTPEASRARHVARIDMTDGVWDGDFAKLGLAGMQSTARMRILREDPFTGEITYLSASNAFKRGAKAERHPIVQEFFMLSGELAGEVGTMHAGAYCFRPPMFKHAPYATPTGAVILFRGLGGKQETYWEDAEPISFHPPHAPILPERLRHLGGPFPRPPRY